MDITKSLEKVFNLLNMIPVQGEGIEIMYAARQELRAVFHELKDQETEKSNEN